MLIRHHIVIPDFFRGLEFKAILGLRKYRTKTIERWLGDNDRSGFRGCQWNIARNEIETFPALMQKFLDDIRCDFCMH